MNVDDGASADVLLTLFYIRPHLTLVHNELVDNVRR